MKTLSLTVMERVIFPDVLPDNGRKVEMILCNDLIKKVEFSAEEVSEFNLKDSGGGRVTWDTNKERILEVELTPEQIDLLKRFSNRIDEEGRVTRYNVALLQKIDDL